MAKVPGFHPGYPGSNPGQGIKPLLTAASPRSVQLGSDNPFKFTRFNDSHLIEHNGLDKLQKDLRKELALEPRLLEH